MLLFRDAQSQHAVLQLGLDPAAVELTAQREAAAEARRKAEEAERRREEAEYYGEFESFPPRDDASENPEATEPDGDNGEDRVPRGPSPPGNGLQAEPAASGDSETGEVEEVRDPAGRGAGPGDRARDGLRVALDRSAPELRG